jgi:prolyl oligopeptidase
LFCFVLQAVDADVSDDVFVTSSGFTEPTTLSLSSATGAAALQQLRSLPAFFDAAGLVVQQFQATSADGTFIPYFQVRFLLLLLLQRINQLV